MSEINVEDYMITDEGAELKANDCPACRGRGRIEGIPKRDHDGKEMERRCCTVCGGSGQK
jgi:DnaJ-class molecular chaperone